MFTLSELRFVSASVGHVDSSWRHVAIFNKLFLTFSIYTYYTEMTYCVPGVQTGWNDGNDYCQSEYGTTLATIRNDDDAQTLLDLFETDGDYWIGLYDYAGDNSGWAWASGYPWCVTVHLYCWAGICSDTVNLNVSSNDILCRCQWWRWLLGIEVLDRCSSPTKQWRSRLCSRWMESYEYH